ncbi:unnamed protein product [Dovyalis caffra]|uniref:Uncharacterized protein n=1 Tax=Dovyalis caffra TaxID=77055 RepID=A0AAV1RM14_9ROSI|nr:unnamed protein product [Dovyalis caffra]
MGDKIIDTITVKLNEKGKNYRPRLHVQAAPKCRLRRQDSGGTKNLAVIKKFFRNGLRFSILNDQENEMGRASQTSNEH